jgi:hypothetical protein
MVPTNFNLPLRSLNLPYTVKNIEENVIKVSDQGFKFFGAISLSGWAIFIFISTLFVLHQDYKTSPTNSKVVSHTHFWVFVKSIYLMMHKSGDRVIDPSHLSKSKVTRAVALPTVFAYSVDAIMSARAAITR